MGKVERFEDLIAWQKARQLTAEIYRIAARGEFSRDFGLRPDTQGSSISYVEYRGRL